VVAIRFFTSTSYYGGAKRTIGFSKNKTSFQIPAFDETTRWFRSETNVPSKVRPIERPIKRERERPIKRETERG
jgi:hypothetical protein